MNPIESLVLKRKLFFVSKFKFQTRFDISAAIGDGVGVGGDAQNGTETDSIPEARARGTRTSRILTPPQRPVGPDKGPFPVL